LLYPERGSALQTWRQRPNLHLCKLEIEELFIIFGLVSVEPLDDLSGFFVSSLIDKPTGGVREEEHSKYMALSVSYITGAGTQNGVPPNEQEQCRTDLDSEWNTPLGVISNELTAISDP
jgi:hypothetical protein